MNVATQSSASRRLATRIWPRPRSQSAASPRPFMSSCKLQQQPMVTLSNETPPSPPKPQTRIPRNTTVRYTGLPRYASPRYDPSPAPNHIRTQREASSAEIVAINIDGEKYYISSLLLRDMCQCAQCVDPSTKQKLFSTVEIPAGIRAVVNPSEHPASVRLRWKDDIPGMGAKHTTNLPVDVLRTLVQTGSPVTKPKPAKRVLWTADQFREDVQDIDYEAYMSDDSVLDQALQHLHTHGLVFVTNVPETESSVSAIAERIGPVKNTFYGYTWDVRSVPQAKNVAYTSQDLGFHMDLLYMEQPPHLQFLHCIRSSSAGGASLFTDSYKAALDLFRSDFEAFKTLSKAPVNFHYDHPESHYYFQRRPVFELREHLIFGRRKYRSLDHLIEYARVKGGIPAEELNITDWIDAVSWSPPFQAPFSLHSSDDPSGAPSLAADPATKTLNFNIQQWQSAASHFNKLIHRPEGVYERMMKPGECVLFDNRRVLHARKAFEVADLGKERWLRGAYLDRDPFESRMRVLRERFGKVDSGRVAGPGAIEKSFESLATIT